MTNLELIKKLLEHPLTAAVFIDLNDDANKESSQAVTDVVPREGPFGPVLILSADWGKHVGG